MAILLHLIEKNKTLSPLVSPHNPLSRELKIQMMHLHMTVPEEGESLHIQVFGHAPRKKKVDNCSFLMRRAVSYLLKYGAVYFEVRLDLHTEQRFSDAWLFSFAAGGWLMLLSKHQDIQLRAMSRNTSNGKVRQTFSSSPPHPSSYAHRCVLLLKSLLKDLSKINSG